MAHGQTRPWAIPGTPGLAHRIGGLEKADGTGAISYDGPNHARMTKLRADKVDGIPVPDLEIHGEADADLLVLGWGSSYGTIRAGARRVREGGGRVATAHLREAGSRGQAIADALTADGVLHRAALAHVVGDGFARAPIARRAVIAPVDLA